MNRIIGQNKGIACFFEYFCPIFRIRPSQSWWHGEGLLMKGGPVKTVCDDDATEIDPWRPNLSERFPVYYIGSQSVPSLRLLGGQSQRLQPHPSPH